MFVQQCTLFIFLLLNNPLRLRSQDALDFECYSCSSIDENAYSSQYSNVFKVDPRDACNDPFSLVDTRHHEIDSRSGIMLERIIKCNSLDSEIFQRDGKYTFHCFKFIGFTHSSGINVTVRGCYFPPKDVGIILPDRYVYDSDSIYLLDNRSNQSIRLRGSLFLCDTHKCNNSPLLSFHLTITSSLLLIYHSIYQQLLNSLS